MSWCDPVGRLHRGRGGVQLSDVPVSQRYGGRGLLRHLQGGREGYHEAGLHPDRLSAQVPHVSTGEENLRDGYRELGSIPLSIPDQFRKYTEIPIIFNAFQSG